LHRHPALAEDTSGRIDSLLEPISGVVHWLSEGFGHERVLRLQVLKPLEHADTPSLKAPNPAH